MGLGGQFAYADPDADLSYAYCVMAIVSGPLDLLLTAMNNKTGVCVQAHFVGNESPLGSKDLQGTAGLLGLGFAV